MLPSYLKFLLEGINTCELQTLLKCYCPTGRIYLQCKKKWSGKNQSVGYPDFCLDQPDVFDFFNIQAQTKLTVRTEIDAHQCMYVQYRYLNYCFQIFHFPH
jgi:hypothetical protein